MVKNKSSLQEKPCSDKIQGEKKKPNPHDFLQTKDFVLKNGARVKSENATFGKELYSELKCSYYGLEDKLTPHLNRTSPGSPESP